MPKCKTPCKSCPYKDTSASGYFGGHDGQDYYDYLNIDTIVACHTRNIYDDEGIVQGEPVACIGHLQAQKNSCKETRHPEALVILKEIKDLDRSNILSVFNFKQHHGLD